MVFQLSRLTPLSSEKSSVFISSYISFPLFIYLFFWDVSQMNGDTPLQFSTSALFLALRTRSEELSHFPSSSYHFPVFCPLGTSNTLMQTYSYRFAILVTVAHGIRRECSRLASLLMFLVISIMFLCCLAGTLLTQAVTGSAPCLLLNSNGVVCGLSIAVGQRKRKDITGKFFLSLILHVLGLLCCMHPFLFHTGTVLLSAISQLLCQVLGSSNSLLRGIPQEQIGGDMICDPLDLTPSTILYFHDFYQLSNTCNPKLI